MEPGLTGGGESCAYGYASGAFFVIDFGGRGSLSDVMSAEKRGMLIARRKSIMARSGRRSAWLSRRKRARCQLGFSAQIGIWAKRGVSHDEQGKRRYKATAVVQQLTKKAEAGSLHDSDRASVF